MFQDWLNRVKTASSAAWQRVAHSRALKWVQQRLVRVWPNKPSGNRGTDSPSAPVQESQSALPTAVVVSSDLKERISEPNQANTAIAHVPVLIPPTVPTVDSEVELAPARWLEGIAKNVNGRMLPWVLIPPERRYRLYIPAGISDRDQPAGLPAMVVMIHGCRQDAETFAAATRMNALADRDGFVVLYPDQSDLANLRRCWNWFEPRTLAGQGETAILLTMIEEAAKRANVNRAQILLAGLSSGGAIAALLAYLHPERFAKVVVHSGLAPFSANSTPAALTAMRDGSTLDLPALTRQYWRAHALPPPPLLIIQGDADETVKPTNADALLDLWASLNQAESPIPLARAEGSTVATDSTRGIFTTRLHAQDSHNTLAERVSIAGLAHAWSGGDAAHPFNDAMGPDASSMIVAFLKLDQHVHVG